jgi:ferric-dicitrate binding protein FerR (iron transport regulator)
MNRAFAMCVGLAAAAALQGCGSSNTKPIDAERSVSANNQPRVMTVGPATVTLNPNSQMRLKDSDIGPTGFLYRGSARILMPPSKSRLSVGVLTTMIHTNEASFEVALDDRAQLTTITVCSGAVQVLANNPDKKVVNTPQVADGYVTVPAGQRGIVNRKGEVSPEDLTADDCVR